MQTQIVDDMIIQTDRNASDIDVENIVNLKKPVRFIKVNIFWEGHKILRNLPLTFDCMYCSQK